jgi:TonB family protein
VTEVVRTLISILAVWTLGSFATAQSSLQTLLEDEFKGKILHVRGFPQNKEVLITANGQMLTDIKAGPWTLGLIEVTGIVVKADEIVFSGNRAGLVYKQRIKKLGPTRFKDRFTIRVVQTNEVVGDLRNADWRKIFILNQDEIPALVPGHWHRFFSAVQKEAPKPPEKNAQKVGSGVSAPQPLRTDEPDYPMEWYLKGIHGVVVVGAIIDETGKPTNLSVERPAGLGLDELAIKAVEKWRFRPAMKDKQPVAVAINIEVNFN